MALNFKFNIGDKVKLKCSSLLLYPEYFPFAYMGNYFGTIDNISYIINENDKDNKIKIIYYLSGDINGNFEEFKLDHYEDPPYEAPFNDIVIENPKITQNELKTYHVKHDMSLMELKILFGDCTFFKKTKFFTPIEITNIDEIIKSGTVVYIVKKR